MNTLGIAMLWCVVQVTFISLLVGGLYLVLRRLRPAAAAPVVLAGLVMVTVLSLLAISPWPRWTFRFSPRPQVGEGQGVRAAGQEPKAESGKPKAESGGQLGQTAKVAGDQDSPRPLGEGQGVRADGSAADLSTAHPSTLSLLWQTLVETVSELQAGASTSTWRWPAVAAAVLLLAVVCGLGWLAVGVAAVRRERLRSRPVVDRELSELLDVLRAELGCVRPVEVRQADNLVTAATIGWRRPVILLPADWRNWTPEQRRAVLAHEIVHARSHDFLALLLGELGVVLQFYHPLVHWLMNRLRLEQELAADAAAASISGGQRQYLTTIAELALHSQDRPMLWPARTFLPTQTTFLRRIAMLRDSKLRTDRLSPVARFAVLATVLLCGVLVAGLRGPGGQHQAVGEEAENPVARKPQAQEATEQRPGVAAIQAMQKAAQETAARTQSMNNMRQIVVAAMFYEEDVRRLPPAYKPDKNGKPLLSWRVLILPYLGQQALYQQFHLDEAWDSEHNSQLIAKMPSVYKSPKGGAGEGKTNYLAICGENTVFSGGEGVQIADITDGTPSTIMMVGANDDRAVVWTKPEDFKYDAANPSKGLGGVWPEGFLAGFVDGTVHLIPSTIDPKLLGFMFTRNDGVSTNWTDVLNSQRPTGSSSQQKGTSPPTQSGMSFNAQVGPLSFEAKVTPNDAEAGAASNGKTIAVLTATQQEKPASENILSNPGAESGEDYADDWLQGGPIEGVKYLWDKSVACEGKASLCIQKTVNRYYPIAEWAQVVQREGDLPTLEVSAQVKAKKAYKAILDVSFQNENDEPISHQWAAYIGAKKQGDPPANHDWKKYSGRVKIPEGTAKICVSLQDYGPGTVWFDDIQARYTNAPADDPEKLLGTAEGKGSELKHDDGTADGQLSSADSGEMIQFTLPTEKGTIRGIRIHGARYGYPQPPAEDFTIFILNEDMSKTLFTETAPYKLFQRGKAKWVDVNFKKAREVPKTFWIVLDFKAVATKGVYVSYDTNTGGEHSKFGLPGQEPVDVNFKGDWMIRVKLASGKTDLPAKDEDTEK